LPCDGRVWAQSYSLQFRDPKFPARFLLPPRPLANSSWWEVVTKRRKAKNAEAEKMKLLALQNLGSLLGLAYSALFLLKKDFSQAVKLEVNTFQLKKTTF
jgi:hypothetical protein